MGGPKALVKALSLPLFSSDLLFGTGVWGVEEGVQVLCGYGVQRAQARYSHGPTLFCQMPITLDTYKLKALYVSTPEVPPTLKFLLSLGYVWGFSGN